MASRNARRVMVGLALLLTMTMTLGMVGRALATDGEAEAGTVGRKIVVFRDGVDEQGTRDSVIARAGATKVRDLRLINAAVVRVEPRSQRSLERHPGVLRVDDDAMVQVQADPVPEVAASAAEALPWGIGRVGANKVWDRDRNMAVDPGANAGAGVKVAVLDTGIDLDHPDLTANIGGGTNIIVPSSSPDDDNGHGTHVAGTIAAADNRLGVIGVAPQASLYAVKVLDSDGRGYVSDIIAGLEWCIANGMQVVNMSFGGSTDVPSFHAAITSAHNEGIVLVAAAGNSGPANNTVMYPAKYPEVVAVSATTATNRITSFSSRGPEVELAAPGDHIQSTYKRKGYATLSGTSMASPHVAGAAALVISSGITDTNGDGRTNDEVRRRLDNTAQDLGDIWGRDYAYGFGLVDAQQATGNPSPPLVVTAVASPVSRDHAQLAGRLLRIGSAPSTNVSFLWGTTKDCTDGETAQVTMTEAGSFFIELESLTPGTRYYFKSKAVGDGTAYGTVGSFRFETIPPRVTTRPATIITSTSATMNGKLLNLGTAPSVAVSLLWGTTSAVSDGETAPLTMTASGTFSVSLPGLTPGTRYYVKAKVVGDGTRYGSVAVFRTPP
ncbi:MAG: S8 family serine peptidase [Chloroflexota bacterium]